MVGVGIAVVLLLPVQNDSDLILKLHHKEVNFRRWRLRSGCTHADNNKDGIELQQIDVM